MSCVILVSYGASFLSPLGATGVRTYDKVKVVFLRFSAGGAFMGQVLVVAVCNMTGRADAVTMFHNGAPVTSVFHKGMRKIFPVDRFDSTVVPLEFLFHISKQRGQGRCFAYTPFDLAGNGLVVNN